MELIEYLPEFIAELEEIKQIMTAEQPEIDRIKTNIERIIQNGFIDTLDDYGCKRWEKMLGITPKANDSLDDRRFRIKLALNSDTPYTMRSLDEKLGIVCGDGNYSVKYSSDFYTLTVRIALRAKQQYEYICELLDKIVPANIVIDSALLYNKYGTVHKLRHRDLKPYKHRGICEEVLY